MSEPSERVALACPACSPAEETVHEVLKPGGQATVRCTDCSHVHKEALPEEEEVELDVIVSQGGESMPTRKAFDAGERLAVGDEFIVDTPEAIMLARVTSLDRGGDDRVEEADVEDVATVWTRAVDNVSVDVTVHPSDDRDDESRSVSMAVPGDYEFVVGEVEEAGDERFEVRRIRVRDEAPKYRHKTFEKEGDAVVAKDVERVYARDETSAAWSAW